MMCDDKRTLHSVFWSNVDGSGIEFNEEQRACLVVAINNASQFFERKLRQRL